MRRSTAYGLSAANPGLLPLIAIAEDGEPKDDGYDAALECKVDAALDKARAERRQAHWWARLWRKTR